VDKVTKTVGKKKAGRKGSKKKAAASNTLTPIETDARGSPEPESASVENLKDQYHLRRYSASEREDYIFGSVSLESAPKMATTEPFRKVLVSSPPLSDNRRPGHFPPRSPARMIVQSPGAGAYAYSKPAHGSPGEVSNCKKRT
jgi:hypothetical protein